MIARGIAILIGAAVLAAVTHLTVLHTGGYGSAPQLKGARRVRFG
jgi:hypothetical protein